MSKRQLCGFCKTFLGVGAGVFASTLFANNLASAVTYQDGADVTFTFNPTITVDLSTSELIISELTPGTSADSNAVTITVSTNTAYGYYLTATAGTSSTSSNLVNTSNNNYVFSSIATNADLASLAVDNTWGYRTSSDNGTTWSNYSGLPRDNNDNGETGKALIETNAPTDSRTLKFKIGAKASTDQAAGTYTNTINFYAVANAEPEPLSMQNMTLADCGGESPVEVTDVRDSETYLVQQLADGNCWMLDNLRLDPTAVSLSALQGNTNASNTTLSYLKNGGGSGQYPASGVSSAWTSSSQNSYTLPYINAASKDTTVTSYGAGSGKVGVYYNYCAASAGSYCYASGSGTGNATEDLCPAGWRMPTGGGYDDGTGTGEGEYFALAPALGLTFDEDEWAFTGTTYQTALSTPLSGRFYDGSASFQGDFGFFWSSTFYDGSGMHSLYVYSGSRAYPTDAGYRDGGDSMRCILDD